jgi:ligand-binding sensor protein
MDKPKIYVFCNSCAPDWHVAHAIAQDGTMLASHVVSSHDFVAHDMGIIEDGWKRDKYAAHYPNGFEVEWVENARPGNHAGFDEAVRLHLVAALPRAEGRES